MDCKAQNAAEAANLFIKSLDKEQKLLALYPFDTSERFNFHFFPKEDRKGISLNQLSKTQHAYAFGLLKTGLSKGALKKTTDIRHLENILKGLEGRKQGDHFRDSGKYFITIFGLPSSTTVWAWRFEGHHISFTFSSSKNRLISGTPGFLGSNPAIIPSGPEKGKEVLSEEGQRGFSLLHSFSKDQLKTALIDSAAPGEIITFVSRRASINKNEGIAYKEMNSEQQQKLLQLIRLYINRYTRLLAGAMEKEIQQGGLDLLKFAWAGHSAPGMGHPHYYRIQGPTIIIEYDNTQNNANHVHTVIRDLKNDFGGDLLLEHYKQSH
ncbi:MAG: DUF3500 domain-containing protein [Flavisolibacter sp.]